MNRRGVVAVTRTLCVIGSLAGLSCAVWAEESAAQPFPAAPTAAPAIPDPDNSVKPPPNSQTAELTVTDAAAAGFMMKCAACHTVGKGPLVGPDLRPSCGWPSKDLSAAIKRMEKNVGPLKDDEIVSLVDLLHSPEMQNRLTAEQQRIALRQTVKMEAPSAARGKRLFEGLEPLTNGGVACTACHRANGAGGTLAKDLTGIFALRGQAALQSGCENASFPVMKAAFQNHPITKQEAFHLVKYFESLQQAEPERTEPAVAGIGMGGAAVAFGLIGLAYRGRNRGVRARLVAKSNRRNGS